MEKCLKPLVAKLNVLNPCKHCVFYTAPALCNESNRSPCATHSPLFVCLPDGKICNKIRNCLATPIPHKKSTCDGENTRQTTSRKIFSKHTVPHRMATSVVQRVTFFSFTDTVQCCVCYSTKQSHRTSCGHVVCRDCMQQWATACSRNPHGLPCPSCRTVQSWFSLPFEVLRLTQLERPLINEQGEGHKENEEDRSLSLATIRRVTKPCPGCHVPIERSDGCENMQCSLCSTWFCWNCGSQSCRCGVPNPPMRRPPSLLVRTTVFCFGIIIFIGWCFSKR